MKAYFIGIDNGGTAIKAAVFDEKGRQLAVARRATPVISPKEGWAQRNMEQMWQLNCGVIREAIEKAGIPPEAIQGVGCTGHGKGLYLWGESGPAYDGIASTDNRAQAVVTELEQAGVAEALRAYTIQPLLACQPASLLVWMKRCQPEVYRSIHWVFEAKDYIRFRLTGEAFAELTDYSGTSLLNVYTADYDDRILQLLGIDDIRRALPPLRYANDLCGRVSDAASKETGLPAGTPVCGGMFDIDACAMAMGMTDETSVAVITGTWSINEYIAKKPVLHCPTTKNSLFCMPGYYLIEESSATSAGNLDWFIDRFMEEEKAREKAAGRSVYSYADALAENTAVSSVLFMPFLYGTNLDADTGACFIGMNSLTTKADMLRAVMEGVVFSHYYHLEKLFSHREKTSAIRLSGGASHSAVWVQMFADVTGLPVEIVDADEIGALGCAITAAVACRYYADYSEAVENMSRIANTVYPAGTALRDKYQAYKRIINCLERGGELA